MKEAAPVSTNPAVIRVRLWAELANLSLVLMELVWIVAFYFALTHYVIPWPKIFLVLGSIILISHYLVRTMEFLRVRFNTRRAIFLGWALLALFGSLRILPLAGQPVSLFHLITHPFIGLASEENASFAEFWHLVLVLVLIWRGASTARNPASIERSLRSFQTGLLIFIAYGFMFGELEPRTGFGSLFAFLFFGLVAIASARIAGVSELRGGKTGRFSHDWVLGITTFALALVGAGIFLGIALRLPVTFLFSQILSLAFIVLTVILVIFTYPLVLLLSWLVPLLSGLLQNQPELNIFKQIQDMIDGLFGKQIINLGNLVGVFNTSRIVGRLAFFVLILIIILAALRWRPIFRRNTGEEEVSDSQGRPRWPALPVLDPRKGLGQLIQARRWLAAARIRRIYAELMDLCARLERPRPAAITPLEFLPQAQELLPACNPELEQITLAYLKVRYGELPETPEEVRTIVNAWERVRGAGRRAIVEHKRTGKLRT